MSRTTMTAAFAALLALSAPAAFAQTTHSASDTTTSTVSMTRVMPGQIRTTEMDGATVYDTQNQNIGDVKDIILDKDGKVAAVVLNVGATLGMGGKYVAVPMNDIKVTFDNNNKPKFAVDMTKEQLKSAQAFDLNEKTATTGTSTAPRSTTTTTTTTTPPTTTK